MKYLIILVSLFIFGSCTENKRTRTFGGHTEMNIPSGRTLINITWKESNMWILTEDSNYYYFTENSSLGIFEGEIKIKK